MCVCQECEGEKEQKKGTVREKKYIERTKMVIMRLFLAIVLLLVVKCLDALHRTISASDSIYLFIF